MKRGMISNAVIFRTDRRYLMAQLSFVFWNAEPILKRLVTFIVKLSHRGGRFQSNTIASNKCD